MIKRDISINTALYQEIGKRLRTIRKKNYLTLEMMSDNLDISKQMLQKYEVGKSAVPMNILYKIFAYYNESPEEFFSGLYELLVFKNN